MAEQLVNSESLLQSLTDSGNLVQTIVDDGTVETPESFIVYYMDQPSDDGILLMNTDSLLEEQITQLVVTNPDGSAQTVQLHNDQSILNTQILINENVEVMNDDEVSMNRLVENKIVVHRNPSVEKVKNRHHECEICHQVFPNVRALRSHRRDPGPCKRMYTGGQKPLICQVCGKAYSRILRYREHLAWHKSGTDGKVQCTECEKSFRIRWEMIQHRMKRHGVSADEFQGLNDRKCDNCGRQFKFKKSFLKHQSSGCDSVKNQLFECERCGKRYRRLKHLHTHQERLCHEEEKVVSMNVMIIHMCELCSKMFDCEENLERHMNDKHAGTQTSTDLPGNQPETEQTVKTAPDHTAQTRNSVPERVQCKFCHVSFNSASLHEDHLKNKHRDKAIYQCDQCDKYFTKTQDLKNHSYTHSGERPFKCRYCDVCVKSSSHLAKHERSHTGEKPYPCPHCPKRFLNIGTRNQHVKSHTKEKPYPCDMCDKRFVTSGLRVSHRRLHTHETRYHCNICQSAFVLRYQLKSHEESHKKGEIPTGKTQCFVCSLWFPKNEFEQHKSKHAVTCWFKCRGCERRFVCEKNCLQHEKSHLSENSESVEEKSEFGREPALKIDLTSAEPRPECGRCKVVFYSLESLLQHEVQCQGQQELISPRNLVRYKHQMDREGYTVIEDDCLTMEKILELMNDGDCEELRKKMVCPRCNYEFKLYDGFCVHIRANNCQLKRRHGKVKCDYCQRIFTHFRQFYEHRENGRCAEADNESESDENESKDGESQTVNVVVEECENDDGKSERSTFQTTSLPGNDKNDIMTNITQAHASKISTRKSTSIGKRFLRSFERLKCDNCSVIFHTAASLHRHSCSKNEPRKTYPCQYCARVYQFKTHLIEHSKTHGKRPGCKCDVCDIGMEKHNLLHPHMILDHGKLPFRCHICDKSAPSLKSLEEHVRSHFEEVPSSKPVRMSKTRTRFQCETCQETFLSAGGLLLHQQKHGNGKEWKVVNSMICKFCGLQCKTQHRLEVHMNNCKMRRKTSDKLQCEQCICEFTSKHYLHQHLQQFHSELTNERRVECPICGETVDEELLRLHVKFHGVISDDDFDELLSQKIHFNNIEIAGRKSGINDTVLEESIDDDHCDNDQDLMEGKSEFRCKECGTSFLRKASTIAHIRRAHRGRVHLLEEIHKKKIDYNCSECNQNFNAAELLKQHHELHHSTKHCDENDKSHHYYSCSTCDETFESEQGLLRHEFYNHVNTCVKCSKTFSTKELLKKHSENCKMRCGICFTEFESLLNFDGHCCEGLGKRKRKRRRFDDFEMDSRPDDESSSTKFVRNGNQQVMEISESGDRLSNEIIADSLKPSTGGSDAGELQHVVVYTLPEPDILQTAAKQII